LIFSAGHDKKWSYQYPTWSKGVTTLFKQIRPKKISEEIVEQIKDHISQGELKPGEKIPSERDLATLLGVSRPSVREALMVLEAMGLVESRQGGGTFVRSLTEESLASPLTSMVEKNPRLLHSLAEVRMGLESWSAFLAASRATPEETARIGALYKEMERQASGGGWDAEVDAQFHYAITTATHNTLQLHVLNTIHGLFHATIQVALTEFYRKAGYVELLLNQHREIFEAIADRDPERARMAMMKHLKLVEEKMYQILKEEKS
jgi:GntR family transcriptional repressor for pyruvate dehydrogenase complex